jgi:hypothetical protein
MADSAHLSCLLATGILRRSRGGNQHSKAAKYQRSIGHRLSPREFAGFPETAEKPAGSGYSP